MFSSKLKFLKCKHNSSERPNRELVEMLETNLLFRIIATTILKHFIQNLLYSKGVMQSAGRKKRPGWECALQEILLHGVNQPPESPQSDGCRQSAVHSVR